MRALVSPGTVFGCATYCEQVVMLDTSARPVVVSCRAAAKLGALLRSPPQLEAQEVVDRVLCDRPHLPPMLSLRVNSVTLDGEGVVCDPDGVTDFDLLRAALGRKGSRRAFLYAFDLLELDGRDLRASPWDDRRKALTKLLRNAREGLRLSEHLAITDGNTLFQHACALGLEGIVAKRRDRPYRSGRSVGFGVSIALLAVRGA